MDTFAQKLLRIYDRKILNGEISFSQSGIKKEDFTRLCIDREFVLSREALETVCAKMKLTEKECAELMNYINQDSDQNKSE